MSVRVVHCLNQFFAGLGGEEQARMAPRLMEGPQGPGRLLESLDPELEVVVSLVFGDDDAAERGEAAVAELLDLLEAWLAAHPDERPDLLVAGPAFRAGRYGLTCGALCAAAAERFGIPGVTAMHPESPGADAWRRSVPIVRAGEDVMDMREAMARLAAAGLALARGEMLGARHALLPRGVRESFFHGRSGAERAVALLLRKLAGEAFETEYALPVFDRVAPAPPVADPGKATLALVTSGGIVPRGNPDGIESASASRFGEYPLEGVEALTPESHQTAHGGYDPTYANADPNRVLPVDGMRALEREGRIGRLHPRYYATVGNGTSVERARRFGQEIAARLVADGVQAVILTST